MPTGGLSVRLQWKEFSRSHHQPQHHLPLHAVWRISHQIASAITANTSSRPPVVFPTHPSPPPRPHQVHPAQGRHHLWPASDRHQQDPHRLVLPDLPSTATTSAKSPATAPSTACATTSSSPTGARRATPSVVCSRPTIVMVSVVVCLIERGCTNIFTRIVTYRGDEYGTGFALHQL